MTSENKPRQNPWLPALLSLIIPGGGQFILHQKSRGVALFITFFLLLALVLWIKVYVLLIPLLLLLLWMGRDAYQLAKGRQPGWGASLLLAGIVLYGAATIVTDVRPARMITGLPSVQPYLRSLLHPELLEQPTK
ncbi:MAG TPA: hypothetical protein PKJ56_11765, partial [Promineifilum sp.]|nr:hypothetical protein [Promineifilum sp.]